MWVSQVLQGAVLVESHDLSRNTVVEPVRLAPNVGRLSRKCTGRVSVTLSFSDSGLSFQTGPWLDVLTAEKCTFSLLRFKYTRTVFKQKISFFLGLNCSSSIGRHYPRRWSLLCFLLFVVVAASTAGLMVLSQHNIYRTNLLLLFEEERRSCTNRAKSDFNLLAQSLQQTRAARIWRTSYILSSEFEF